MKDPCQECDNLEKRNQFLEQGGASLLDNNDSRYRMAFRQSFTESQEDGLKYKHLFETAPDAIFIADVESGLILDANESAAKLLDIPVNEIIGMHQSKLHPAEESERYKKMFREHIEKGIPIFSDDIYVCRRDGQKIHIQINATVTQIGSKKILFGIFRNITQQQQLLDCLEAGEVRFKRLAEATFEAIAIHQDGEIIDVNQQYLDMFGYTLDEVKKIPDINMIAPQSRALVEEKMASKYEGIYEAFGMKKDGTIFPVEIQAKETVLDGQPIRIGAIRDMTELRASQKLYQTVVQNAHEAIMLIDSDGNYLFMNDFALQKNERTLDQVVGKNMTDLFPKEYAYSITNEIQTALTNNEASLFRHIVPLRPQPRWNEVIIIPLKNVVDQSECVLLMAHDIHEETLLKEKLIEGERKYKELYDNAHVALFRTALDGTLLQCNRACLPFFGYSYDEDLDNFINAICVADHYVDPSRRQAFIDALKTHKRVKGFEAELKKADGTTVWVSFSAEVFPEVGYIEGAMYDITVSKSLTKTENQILDHLMQGKSNKEIARQLRRSVRTVEDHRSNIMRKLGVDNLVDLTQKALNLHNQYTEE